ncbi:LuxR family transcriptional regulator [Streptacidiphilus sp. NEAU-YB345]|uniref:LuxR family transcriptional regulator n=1 Tax=Streptacidiphilus fuscans TaxID=2789292 RepID=A0A931B5C7_9ACTN|nr:LuxR family transcriptional regulator [Streptacidiphilus fuscans]
MCTDPDAVDRGAVELCEEGLRFYGELLKGGSVTGECPLCLLEFGLVKRLPEGGLTALAPHAALWGRMEQLEEVIQNRRRALDKLHRTVSRADRVYRESYSPTGSAMVRVVTGAEAISATLSATVSACQSELLTAQPGGGRPPELLEKALYDDLSALGRGVRQRTVYQHTIRSHAPTLAYAEKIVEAGGEIRTVDEVFDRLIICDRQTAFVPDPAAANRRDLALVIEHPGVVRYLAGMFEHIWQRAVPLQPNHSSAASSAVTDEVRRAVLRHMINGYTDSAIAARLGMSLRSVTNHVRWAADFFGSRSRAQLAYLLARSGFLEED